MSTQEKPSAPLPPPAERFGRRDLPTQPQQWRERLTPGSKVRWSTLALITTAFVVTLLVLAVFFVPAWIDKGPPGIVHLRSTEAVSVEISLDQARNSVRTALIQAIGGALVLLTFAVGLGQLLVARQGQLVDRFTRAVDQLGNEDVGVRLGGIFALQQMAERAEYSRPVAEILVAYLKSHTTTTRDEHRGVSDAQTVPGADRAGEEVRLRPDLQAALRIVAALWASTTGSRLDLSFIDVRYADLAKVDLSGAILLGAILDGSDLRGARLSFTDLREVSLVRADLSQADLSNSDLRNANLESAMLEKALLTRSLLTSTNLRGAKLKQAGLVRADLTKACVRDATLNGAKMEGAVLVGADFSHSDLSGSNLRDVRTDDMTNWQETVRDSAVMDEDTRHAIEE
jgi:uncharacterized protein YjbI with pentapeptide repeats